MDHLLSRAARPSASAADRRGGTRLAGLAALLLAVVTGCSDSVPTAPTSEPTTAPPSSSPPPPATSEPATEPAAALGNHAVSAGHPAAVDAGMQVLDAGGSAVDAAVATAFAVAVVEPFASGIGGGGAALVVPTGEGEPQAYDYREVVARDGRIPESGTGVPGFVAGMAALHEDHGELPWSEVIAPAIELASDGFEVSDFLALRMRSDHGPAAVGRLEHFSPGGEPLAAGQRLVQEDLAATMRTIADGGADAFYDGPLTEALTTVDGLDAASLAAYEVVRTEPVEGAFGDHRVLAAAPPLPGAGLVQMLQVAEAAGVGGSEPGSARYVEQLSRAWQVADRSVDTVVGDPAFVDVPVDELTDPARNAELAADVVAAGEGDGDVVAAPERDVVPGNTTHLTVVDRDGLMVSMTNTITSFWGSGEMVGGFFLNNQLSRFDSIGSTAANEPAPGRRSVSWSLPTVVVDGEGRPVLGIGSPGGRQIPNVLANVLTRWGLHDQPLADAVASPRFILEGSTLTTETQPPPADAEAYEDLGWSVDVVAVEEAVFGSVQALEVNHDTGEITGTADTRREADFAVGQP
ncbi:gamma-glutamyltransferase [Georgenia daeguensis]|uniref:Gamma-glutamyltransferase n=1 Tax=Georgenia daeguensis TaxID=908355 RepID=A0ABP8EXP2_9MICO